MCEKSNEWTSRKLNSTIRYIIVVIALTPRFVNCYTITIIAWFPQTCYDNISMEKIAFFEIEDWEGGYLTDHLGGFECSLHEEPFTEHNADAFADVTVLSAMVYSQLHRDTLSKLPNLKLIATRTTGFDNIDLAYCKEQGIEVCNVPSYGAHTVAEHTFALIFALSRKLVPSINRTRRGDFTLEKLEGFDLWGKTLGVVGTGNIGKRVVQIASAIGMNVLVFAHHTDEDLVKDLKVKFVDFDTVISQSDIVTLHVPGTPENTHLINRENIQKFKKGSYLINTARGSLVDTEAIVEALENGILLGAGLDVLEGEVSIKEERELKSEEFLKTCDLKTVLLDHILLDRDDVVITPHNAFHSHEALIQILDTTVQNIRGFFDKNPQNVVS